MSMARVKILYDNLVRKTGVSISGSSFATSMPDSNIGVAHPNEPWRITTLSGAETEIILTDPVGYGWDMAAVLYSTTTPYRNQLKHAGNGWSTYPAIWELSGLTSVSQQVGFLPLEAKRSGPLENARWQRLTENTSTSEHYLSQDVTVPFAGVAGETYYFTASCYLAYQTSGRDLRLQVDDGAGSPASYVRVDYDVSAETLGSVASTGYTGIDEALGSATSAGGWVMRRVTVTGSCAGTVTTLRLRLQMLSGGTASYLGTSETMYVGGPMVEFRGSTTEALSANVSEFDSPVAAVGGTWRLGVWDASGFSGEPDYEARLLHCTPGAASTGRSDLMAADLGYVHSWLDLDSISGVPYPWVKLWFNDPDNANSSLDIGVVAIGKTFSPATNISSGTLSLSWLEKGDETEARGGQEYRPVNSKRRQLSFTLSWLNKEEAYGDVSAMQRICGRSEPVLVIVDSNELEYPQEMAVYGFLEDLGPVTHRSVYVYEHAFSITEVLP